MSGVIGVELDELIGTWVVDLDTGTLFCIHNYVSASDHTVRVVYGIDLNKQRVTSRSFSVLRPPDSVRVQHLFTSFHQHT